MRRRREFGGAVEAVSVRFEEALSGRTRSASEAALRSLWRRRWGSSAAGGVGIGSGSRDVFIASFPPIVASVDTVEIAAPLLVPLAFSNNEFVEK